jgi:hypothetical protein
MINKLSPKSKEKLYFKASHYSLGSAYMQGMTPVGEYAND